MTQTVGIVVPAYKPDPDTLNEYVKELLDSVADTVHIELDAPSESTLDMINYDDSINVAPKRRGKGKAITEGFNALSTDILAFADADASVPVSSVGSVVSPIRGGIADLAIGSRRHPDAIIKTHQTKLRRRMGDVFAWSARRILPTAVYDYQCGVKALSAGTWKTLCPHIYEAGFAWDLEVIAMAGTMGYHIEEVPITWDDEPASTVDPLSTPINMASTLFSIRHRINTIEGNQVHPPSSRIKDDEMMESNTSGDD